MPERLRNPMGDGQNAICGLVSSIDCPRAGRPFSNRQGIGGPNRQRSVVLHHAPPDLIVALAQIHQLAAKKKNARPPTVAEVFAHIANHLVIEFAPNPDTQVQPLSRSCPDISPDYNRPGYAAAFADHFEFVESVPAGDYGRNLYLMRARRLINSGGKS